MLLHERRVKSGRNSNTRLPWGQVNINIVSSFHYSLAADCLLLTSSVDVVVHWVPHTHLPASQSYPCPCTDTQARARAQGSKFSVCPLPLSVKSGFFLRCTGYLLGPHTEQGLTPRPPLKSCLRTVSVNPWVFAPTLQPQHCYVPASYTRVGRPGPTFQIQTWAFVFRDRDSQPNV